MVTLFKNCRVLFVLLLMVMCTVSSYAVPKIMKPDGFAAGVTGGGNATPKEVTSMSELNKLVGGSSPAVIIVKGKLSGKMKIGSNKTIVGANSQSGMSGFSSSGSNNIIQNLSFGPSGGDVAEIKGGKNFFITKCEFHDCGDELLSMVSGCDKITISWSKFYFNKTHEHAFGHLIGSSDGDKGKYNTTFHHNWYTKGMVERMPRVRFGTVHIYNNLYDSDKTHYNVGVGVNSKILIEGCYFKDQGDLTFFDWRNGTSVALQVKDDNKFVGNSTIPDWVTKINGQSFKPPYEYSVDNIENVPDIVKAGAGNVIGDYPTHLIKKETTADGSNSLNLVLLNSADSKLSFNLEHNTKIHVTVHDNMGRVVIPVLDGTLSAGSHSVQLNQSRLAKGVYYLNFRSNAINQMIKIHNY